MFPEVGKKDGACEAELRHKVFEELCARGKPMDVKIDAAWAYFADQAGLDILPQLFCIDDLLQEHFFDRDREAHFGKRGSRPALEG